MGDAIKTVVKEFAIHFKTMMFKNWLVTKRSYKGTIVQILAPALFLILLFGLDQLPSGDELDPPVEPFKINIPRCDPSLSEQNKCATLFYTVNTTIEPFFGNPWGFTNLTGFWNQSDADSIMQLVAEDNSLQISAAGFTLGDLDRAVNTIFRWDNATEMEQYILDNPNVTQSAVVFNSFNYMTDPETNPTYTILYNGTDFGQTDFTAINAIQYSLEKSIMTFWGRYRGVLAPNQKADFQVRTRQFPIKVTQAFDAPTQFGGLFFYCAIMFNFSLFLYQIVNEKALKLRLGMRMIGLSDVAYWLSWEVTNLIQITVYSLIIIFLGYICGIAFFLRTNFFVLFFTFWLFGFAMTQLAVFIGMFLSSTRQAINVGMLIFLLGTITQIIFSVDFILEILYNPDQASPAYRIILQFYPPFNFSKMIYEIGFRSNKQAVAQLGANDPYLLFPWSGLYEPRDLGDFEVPAPFESLWYLVMNIGIFSILSWYFYNVMGSEKANPFHFLFTRDYWRAFLTRKDVEPPAIEDDKTADEDVQAESEKALKDTDAALRVFGLRKTFYKLSGLKIRKLKAVRGVSLSVQQGQVFALLGHNGAGKTTTLNMLTGVLRPGTGDAFIYGKSISHSLPDIQKMIGVCPQHDILWAELTAREHLEIFAELRNVPKEERNEQIEARLKDVLLLEAADKAAGKYSGGMKRRLSVAISAIGNPKIIYLDEPTTGLDPQSRREIWGAIQRLKKNRVIILTSHSMEEADALGDRIGIMAHGKLKCIGTSLHLKNKFGLGYRLNITCLPDTQPNVRQIIGQAIPGAHLLAETGVNFIYGIQTQDLPKLVPFFKYIESNAQLEGFFIKDWGLSQTTLEEVFLKVTKDDAHEVIIE